MHKMAETFESYGCQIKPKSQGTVTNTNTKVQYLCYDNWKHNSNIMSRKHRLKL